MRLIDADSAVAMTATCPKGMDIDSYIEGMCVVLDRIYEAPTVQETIRCEDCKHYRESDAGHPDCGYCNRLICGTVRPDFYCADGERKDDAHE